MAKLEGGEVEPVQLQKVDIYIDQVYSGNFKNGEGKYSIVLEVIKDGQPVTKEHFRGYKGTSKNRLPLLACIDALKCMKVACEIKFHVDSPSYIIGSLSFLEKWKKEGLEKHKNADLWEKYMALADKHLISFEQEKHNQYTPAMRFQIGVKEIAMIEDYREENQF